MMCSSKGGFYTDICCYKESGSVQRRTNELAWCLEIRGSFGEYEMIILTFWPFLHAK